ncbi:cysteine hydrolase [Catenulispora sp. NL8]|uniref:Cysteine hydrolase n=1 Tax=Catenulispora pinistramenti TaxID=2705254 RepID=A0ABS5L186_9ACTN|nr:isochorismatase family cysteine hydrolase [Catenulispora pinistramenti]MBS2551910.1 cysteine hydrolase [Catenulispora pinistramenti]
MPETALLVMDVQQAIVDRHPDADYLPRLRGAIDAARAAGVPVVYVVVGFRPGHPDISPRNKTFGALAQSGRFVEGDLSARIHPDVAPLPGEVVVTKKRVSAFAGSDLDVVLRAGDVRHLVLTGIATSGVVLSTLRQAADLDFGLTVLADGCLDGDLEVHRVLTEKVFPRQADVATVEEWAGAVGR